MTIILACSKKLTGGVMSLLSGCPSQVVMRMLCLKPVLQSNLVPKILAGTVHQ